MPDMPATHGNAMALGTTVIASSKRPNMLRDCVIEA